MFWRHIGQVTGRTEKIRTEITSFNEKSDCGEELNFVRCWRILLKKSRMGRVG